MKINTIKNYQGVLYEMVKEIEAGKSFPECRRETAAWLRQYDKEASREIAFLSQKELSEAYLSIEKQQSVFDVRS